MRKGLVCGMASMALIGFAQFARADDEADAKAILQKAAKAIGGEEALAKVKGITTKGKGTVHVNGMDIEYTSESTVLLPEKQRVTMAMEVMNQKIDFASVFDGKKLAIKVGGNAIDPGDDKIAEAKEQMYAARVTLLLPLKEPGVKLATMGEFPVGNRTALGVRVSHKDHRDVRLYFDKETHLLIKSEAAVKDEQTGKEVEQEILFTEHKEFGGIKFAVKVTMKRDGKAFLDGETVEVTMADTYDDALFEKP